MGSRVMHQRRGKGGAVFRSQRKGLKPSYISNEFTANKTLNGIVVDLLRESGRDNVLAKILFENNESSLVVAAEGIGVGDNIKAGIDASIKIGNILPLKNIPEGCPVFNIEKVVGDGGAFIKGSGLFGLLVAKGKKATIKMPSGKLKEFPLDVRSTIGNVAGGEREEKPFVKAGNKFKKMKAKTRKYAKTRGVAMNANSHPHGGEQHHVGKSKSVSRHASIKVGAIASKRTGRRKK